MTKLLFSMVSAAGTSVVATDMEDPPPQILIRDVRIFNGTKMNELCGPNHPYPEGAPGVIVEGAYADLLLVDGNPLEDILLLTDPDKNLKLSMKSNLTQLSGSSSGYHRCISNKADEVCNSERLSTR